MNSKDPDTMSNDPTVNKAAKRRNLFIALALAAVALFAYAMSGYHIMHYGLS
jgi:hypothetical protein